MFFFFYCCFFFSFFLATISINIHVALFYNELNTIKTFFNYIVNKTINFDKINITNCSLCNFTIRNDLPNSNKNDIIFATGIKKVVNLLPFAKTLRTTGSQAQVVVITDEIGYESISIETLKESNNCGVQIFNIGNIKNLNPKYVGFELILSLIEYNFEFINRIIISDLYDTVFQGDPFSQRVSSDYVQFIDEDITFLESETNVNWVKAAIYRTDFKKKWLNLFPICSGYIIGGKIVIFRFLIMFYSFFNFKDPYFMDQGLLNNLILTGAFEIRKIPYLTNGENFTVRHLAHNFHKIPFSKLGDFKLDSHGIPKTVDRYAQVVHHYYDHEKLCISILESCPRRNSNFTNYHRTISDDEITRIERKNNL